jgi:prolipoprotein diacylglyceryltransferase
MYPYLELFGHTISTYWLCAMVGLFLCAGLALLRRRAVRFHTSAEDVILTILCCVIGALLGAKVFQLVGLVFRDGANPDFWSLENWKGLLLSGVGVFYGGLIGGASVALIYIRQSKLTFGK